MTSPGNRSFFKYASPKTALAVLRNKTVRYSSPLTFNDPFDVQAGLHFDFDLNTLHEKVLDRLHELAAAPEEPKIDAEDVWGKIVLLTRQYYPTHGFPRDRWKEMSHASFGGLVDEIKTSQKKYQEHWWEKLLPGIRMFCVAERPDNLLMWAHYAKDHTGAVFEFLSLPEEDNPLSVARPIIYAETPPPLFTERELLDDILSLQKFDVNELYKRYAYCKSNHWSYENEWRVWYPTILAPESLYDDMPIRASEFSKLIIGCKATNSFVSDAVSLTRSNFPSVKIFRAEKKDNEYALEYMPI